MRHKVTIYTRDGITLTLEAEHVILDVAHNIGPYLRGSTVYVNPDARAVRVEPIPDDSAAVVDACMKEIEAQIKGAWDAASKHS